DQDGKRQHDQRDKDAKAGKHLGHPAHLGSCRTRDAKVHALRFARHAQHVRTLGVLPGGYAPRRSGPSGSFAANQATLRITQAPFCARKKLAIAMTWTRLRPARHSWSARRRFLPTSARLIRRNCLECAVILGDWLINDMVAAGAYI